MGAGCSRSGDHIAEEVSAADIPDPEIYEFLKKSIQHTQPGSSPNQHHLLFKQQQTQLRHGGKSSNKGVVSVVSSRSSSKTTKDAWMLTEHHNSSNTSYHSPPTTDKFSTRLLFRRYSVKAAEEGFSGTHIFAVRWNGNTSTFGGGQEQCPHDGGSGSDEIHTDYDTTKTDEFVSEKKTLLLRQEDRPPKTTLHAEDDPRQQQQQQGAQDPILSINHLFQPSTMATPPKRKGRFILFSNCSLLAGWFRFVVLCSNLLLLPVVHCCTVGSGPPTHQLFFFLF